MHGFFSCPAKSPGIHPTTLRAWGRGVPAKPGRREDNARTWWVGDGRRLGPRSGDLRLDILQDMGTSQLIDHVPSLGDRVVHTRAVGTCTITSFECSQD